MTSAATGVPDPALPVMHAISQIIERNLHRREHCESGLWINPGNDDGWRKTTVSCPSMKLFSQDFGTCSFLRQGGADIEFSAFPAADKKYRWIILNLPRQKALLRMMLDCAADLLAENGVLWLAGENKAGIKSANTLLKSIFSGVRKLDSARHCSLYEAREPLAKQAFDPLSYRQEWPLYCGPSPLQVISYPGVFAHGRLDAGTALLLEVLTDTRMQGDVLDFACGAGLVGACVGKLHPNTRVTLLDSSALALRASEETLAANRLQGTLLASDGLSSLTGSYDFIISNPPIHAGRKTDSQLGMRLLENAHEHINKGGMLILVANVHLPYEKWLTRTFSRHSERLANDNYKVILAKR